MRLLPDQKPRDADYAAADEWLTAVDLPEGDIRIPLKRGAGLWVRYRGISLAEEQAAFRAARAALVRMHLDQKIAPPGPDESDFTTLVTETLRYGIVSPHLTAAQAAGLRDKNPEVLEQLYLLIRNASRMTPEELDDIVDRLVQSRTGGRSTAPDAGSGDIGLADLGATGRAGA